VVAYVHALRHHLRNQDRLPELEPFLPASELDALEHEQNRPLAILQRLSADLRAAYERGWIHAQHVPVVDGSIEQLIDLQGGCERIKATPIPFSYNVLLHRIVFVYCFTLPFGLVDIPGLNVFTPVVVALVSYAFFGLDAVGEEIEEPFGEDPNDLPLGAITRTIEINLRQRLGDAELPPAANPVKNVLT
ncbi:MAG: bestrophin family protein, partial [Myxococcales bacterium]|nr:bestrophin family protein [Myxococcales bacterium]